MSQVTVLGTPGNDSILTGLGPSDSVPSDWILGPMNAGGTVVLAGAGDDRVVGGPGSPNNFDWEDGDDSLSGGFDNDTLRGGEGDDALDSGTRGADLLEGGPGRDTLSLFHGGVRAAGGAGADLFRLAGLFNSEGPPGLAGQALLLDFDPVSGDRLVFDGTGALPTGGSGRSAIVFGGVIPARTELLATAEALPDPFPQSPTVGVYWVTDSAIPDAGWVLADADRSLTLTASDYAVRVTGSNLSGGDPAGWFDPVELALIGTPRPDRLPTGIGGPAYVFGGDGDDALSANGSFVRLDGGEGNDVLSAADTDFDFDGEELVGGPGDDTYFLFGHFIFVREEAGEGFDVVFVFGGKAVISPNIEAVFLTGAAMLVFGSTGDDTICANPDLGSTLFGGMGNDTLWGTALADELDGGEGNDVLRSQGDADVMMGGSGDDTFVVFDAAATVIEGSGAGFDTVWVNAASWSAPNSSEIELMRLVVAGRATGNEHAQTMSAHAPDTTLDGAGGDDALWGDDSRNVLLGGAGDDVLRGGAGDDVLDGGVGADQLVGGAGADLFVFADSVDPVLGPILWSPSVGRHDQVFDFVRGEDKLRFLNESGTAYAFGDLVIVELGGNTRIQLHGGGAAVDLYGVTGITAADFAF